MNSNLYNEILDDTIALVQRAVNPRKGTIALSRETAALLDRVQASIPLPEMDAAPPSDLPDHPSSSHATLAATPLPATDAKAALAALAAEVSQCTKCGLCHTRTQTVFSDGSPTADLVFVGEAPGFYEDQQGIPFVGAAGQLLTDIITKGMKLRREDVYICNVIKCRPPENRDPSPEEKRQCEPYLVRQLELVRPKVICALGGHAAKTLLKTDAPTGKLRGKWHFYHGIPLRVTFHPAYLLRTPEDKRKTWEDIQEVMKVLNGEVVPGVATAAEPSLFE
jgi:uracil-DNA glycosylase family 4